MTVNKLTAVVTELDQRTDILNYKIRKHQSIINGCRLGLTVWLSDPIVPDYYLGYGKRKGAWGFLIKKTYFEPQREESYQSSCIPLLESSRHLRIKAYPHLSVLQDLLLVTANDTLHQLKDALGEEIGE